MGKAWCPRKGTEGGTRVLGRGARASDDQEAGWDGGVDGQERCALILGVGRDRAMEAHYLSVRRRCARIAPVAAQGTAPKIKEGKCRSPVLSWGEVRSAHHPISICTFLAPPMEPGYLDQASCNCKRPSARPNASSAGARCGNRDRRRPSTQLGRDTAAGRRCRQRPGRAPTAFAARDENDLEISAVEVLATISEGPDSEVTILGSTRHNMQTKTDMLTTYSHMLKITLHDSFYG